MWTESEAPWTFSIRFWSQMKVDETLWFILHPDKGYECNFVNIRELPTVYQQDSNMINLMFYEDSSQEL